MKLKSLVSVHSGLFRENLLKREQSRRELQTGVSEVMEGMER